MVVVGNVDRKEARVALVVAVVVRASAGGAGADKVDITAPGIPQIIVEGSTPATLEKTKG